MDEGDLWAFDECVSRLSTESRPAKREPNERTPSQSTSKRQSPGRQPRIASAQPRSVMKKKHDECPAASASCPRLPAGIGRGAGVLASCELCARGLPGRGCALAFWSAITGQANKCPTTREQSTATNRPRPGPSSVHLRSQNTLTNKQRTSTSTPKDTPLLCSGCVICWYPPRAAVHQPASDIPTRQSRLAL